MRTPISRTGCVTRCDITPYTPVAEGGDVAPDWRSFVCQKRSSLDPGQADEIPRAAGRTVRGEPLMMIRSCSLARLGLVRKRYGVGRELSPFHRNWPAPQLTAGERTIGRDWANIAFWVRTLAELLSVTLQQQVTSGSGIKVRWQPTFDQFLCFAICPSIILSFLTCLDTDQHVWAVRRNRCHR